MQTTSVKFVVRLFALAALAATPIVSSIACSTDFSPTPCTSDADCSGGLICSLEATPAVCSDSIGSTILVGTVGPLSGVNQSVGVEARKGIQLAFDAQNAQGGIRGRQLELVSRDDVSIPTNTVTDVEQLLNVQQVTSDPPRCPSSTTSPLPDNVPVPDISNALVRGPGSVIALLGNVGPTQALLSGPYVIETGALWFGTMTGLSPLLRDNTAGACSSSIFNVRASYEQEAAADIQYLQHSGVPDPQHFITYVSEDVLGLYAAGIVQGTFKAVYNGLDTTQLVSSPPDDMGAVDAKAEIAESQYIQPLLDNDTTSHHTVGIAMGAEYAPAAEFIKKIRQWQYANPERLSRLTLLFIAISDVSANALSTQLVGLDTTEPLGPAGASYTTDVTVSNVVPNYDSDQGDITNQYNAALLATNQTPSFPSFEGYVAARVFILGLLAHNGPFTPEALVGTFESLPAHDIGLGPAGFSSQPHQYLNSVWGTGLNPDGTFKNRFFWSNGSLQPITQ
ncbi:MAG: ABC transporter substrate-binding protein [Polyangiaceae bacterium]|nr:ABC transporter substrate-binding protein [Polyangiaceae bacterium]